MNTEKRIASGVLVGFISFTLTFVQSILLVPILLTIWGNETYGIWLVLNAGYIILQTIDSGQQFFIGNEFNIKYFSEKMDLRVILASSLRMAFLIGIFQALIVFFLFMSNTTNLFLGIDALVVSKESLTLCLVLLILAWISSGSYASIISKLLMPYGYYTKSIWWNIFNKSGSFVVLVIIAFNHGSILDATIGISIFSIVYNLLLLLRIKFLLPEVYPWWEFGNWKTGFSNLKKSVLISLIGILQQFNNSGIIILITNLFGAATVPVYSTVRTLTNSAAAVTNIIIQPLQPDLVKFRVKKELNKMIEIFNINWLISGFIINVCILISLPFISDIYSIWTRGKIIFNQPLFLLLAWSISIFNFGSVLVFYLHSLNKIRQQLMITVTKLVLIFSLSILFYKNFGIISVGIGIATAEFIATFLVPFLLIKNELNIIGADFNFRMIAMKMLPSLILGIVFILVSIYNSYLSIFCIVGIIIFCLMYFANWKSLSIDVRKRILQLLKLNKFFSVS